MSQRKPHDIGANPRRNQRRVRIGKYLARWVCLRMRFAEHNFVGKVWQVCIWIRWVPYMTLYDLNRKAVAGRGPPWPRLPGPAGALFRQVIESVYWRTDTPRSGRRSHINRGNQHKIDANTEMRFTVYREPHFCVYMLAWWNPWALFWCYFSCLLYSQ